MKVADVCFGGEYLARVSEQLVRVRVMGSREERRGGVAGRPERRRLVFELQRVDNGRQLKPRPASALRPMPTTPEHTRTGNCFARNLACKLCGIGVHCDVCHEHEEPRGVCGGCEECPVCEANSERLEAQLDGKESAS